MTLQYVVGERDGCFAGPKAQTQKCFDETLPRAKHFPNLQKVTTLPNTGHWVQHEQPEQIARLITQIITQ